jgi:tetratricopeptide (TPR) repeat protein
MVSRRDFLFSAVRRMRQNVDDVVSAAAPRPAQPVSGIGREIGEADRLFGEGELERAREGYKGVLAREPRHVEARVQLMVCHYRLGDLNPAKVCAQQVLQKNPENHTAKLFLGLTWVRKGNLEKAMQAWEGYFDMNNRHVLREINVYKALFEEGEELDCEEVAREIEESAGCRSAQCAVRSAQEKKEESAQGTVRGAQERREESAQCTVRGAQEGREKSSEGEK